MPTGIFSRCMHTKSRSSRFPRDWPSRTAPARRSHDLGRTTRPSAVWLVLPEWIEHSTSSLPMRCSTTELRQLKDTRRRVARAVRTRRKLPQGPPEKQGEDAILPAGFRGDNETLDIHG